jgi:protein-tyrosine phosphatase
MTTHANEIIPGLWIGDFYSSQDKDFFETFHIKCVINATTHIQVAPFYKQKKISFKRVPVYDSNDSENLSLMIKHKSSAINFIDGAQKLQHPMLVHCHAGMQRSATIVAFFLMQHYNMTKKQAIKFIKSRRNICFEPVPTFDKILIKDS